MIASGFSQKMTLFFIRTAEDYLEEQSGSQVGPVVLFGRDGKVLYWLRREYWDGSNTLEIEWPVPS